VGLFDLDGVELLQDRLHPSRTRRTAAASARRYRRGWPLLEAALDVEGADPSSGEEAGEHRARPTVVGLLHRQVDSGVGTTGARRFGVDDDVLEGPRPVHDDQPVLADRRRAVPHGDVHRSLGDGEDPPLLGGGAVAQHRTRPAVEQRGGHPGRSQQGARGGRVDAVEDRPPTARLDLRTHDGPGDAEPPQLRDVDDAVLPVQQLLPLGQPIGGDDDGGDATGDREHAHDHQRSSRTASVPAAEPWIARTGWG
jgi:hypothetical protein